MDKRMIMQKLQEIHHMSGELLQMMGEMGQREGMPYRNNMGYRDDEGRYTQQDVGRNMGQRERYVDPWMY